MYAKAWESLKSPDLPLPASIQYAVSLTSASSFRHVGGVSAGAQSTVTVEERLTSSGTETDSLIRRHPKIFLVSLEHLVQQVSNSLFQREGRGAFNCSFLRIDLQFRSGNHIRSHKRLLVPKSGIPHSAFTYKPQELGQTSSPADGAVLSGYRLLLCERPNSRRHRVLLQVARCDRIGSHAGDDQIDGAANQRGAPPKFRSETKPHI